MKKILNFSLCMILVLSLCAGNMTFGLDSAGSYVYANAEEVIEVTPKPTVPTAKPTVTPTAKPTVVPTVVSTATPTVEQCTAKFFIRISNEEPKEPYSYPSTDYHPVGTGTIIAEEVCNNPEAVKAHVISFQLEGQYAERYKMDVDNIKWYVIKRESDGWHVDGVIKKEQIVVVPTEKPTAVPTVAPTVTPTAIVTVEPTVAPTVTPTAVVTVAPTTTAAVVSTEKPEEIETPDPVTMVAKFFLLIENLEQPEEPFSHPTKNYVYVGTGTVIQEEVANDDEKVKRNILEAPDVSKYETDGWLVRWYVIKHESDCWHVDGIREKSPSTVTPPAVTATAPAVTATAPAVTATAPAVTATVPVKETNRPTVTYLPFGPQKPSVNPTTKPEASALPTTKPETSVLPVQTPEQAVTPTVKAEPTVSPTSNPDTGKDLPNKTENPAVDADNEKDEINNGTPEETSDPGEGTKVEESAKPEEGIIPTENPGSANDNKGTDNVDPTQSAVPTNTTDPTTGSDDTTKVPDGTIPATHPDSDYEDVEEPSNPITTPDMEEIEPDDIASSGVSKDTDDEDDTSKKTKQEQKDDDDTVTVSEKDIPNSDVSASPKTGDNSGNVLFIFGRMICALGVFIFVLKRRKVTK